MKSKIFKYLIIFLAIGSIATECDPDEPEQTGINGYFTIEPETGTTSTNFEFDGSKFYYYNEIEQNYDVNIRWDFDYTGEDDNDWDLDFSTQDIVYHKYTVAKDYTVRTEVHSNGKFHNSSKSLEVTDISNTPPVANFEGSHTNGAAPLDVNFTDLSTNDPTGWLWDFGNGESSTEQNPSYTYSVEGTYSVKLTVSNSDGNDDEEKIDYITVTSGVVDIPCPGEPTVSDIDGNIYNTVLIGDQCWMKENLKTTTYEDGTPIPNVTDGYDWSYLFTGAYCWYENEDSWKDKYGALYNWYAVDDPKGLCPIGWHVPTYDELNELIDHIGGIGDPHGNELQSCWQVNSPFGGDCNTTDHPRWQEYPYHGTNNYGFSALPGGRRRYAGGNFESLGSYGYWWTSTSDAPYSANYLYLTGSPTITVHNLAVSNGYSIRCVKND